MIGLTPNIAIIMLNWNGWIDTIECLESLFQITYPNYSVVLVDNASKDGSVEKIRDYCNGNIKIESKFFQYDPKNKPIKVKEFTVDDIEISPSGKNKIFEISSTIRIFLIKNDQNDGFAEGNNIGIRYALKALNPDYFLLLNNDTVMEKDFLDKLIDFTEKNPNIGIIGPKILYYDDPSVINSAGAIFHWWTGIGKNIGAGASDKERYNERKEVDCVLGCAFLIKKSVIDDIGMLDKSFFIMLEETDFCLRAKEKGYKIYYNPEARIYHKEGASLHKVSETRLYFLHRNRVLIAKKNYPLLKKLVSYPFIIFRGIIAMIYYLLKLELGNAHIIAKAYRDAIYQHITE